MEGKGAVNMDFVYKIIVGCVPFFVFCLARVARNQPDTIRTMAGGW